MFKKVIAFALAAVALVACTSKQKIEETEGPKVLVLYYSQTGATKTVAEEIQKQLAADIEAIEVTEPYDGDFNQTIERCQKEMAEGVTPELTPLKSNIDEYDIVFLGYPVWFGTYAQPIATLVKTLSFEGKKVVPFCTFGSGGLNVSSANLKAALPKAEILDGYGVRNARIAAVAEEVTRFLIERGYKEGEIEALPAFMEQHPVSEEEAAIFNAACADYPYPIGTPVQVAVRTTSASTDYLFTAESQNPTGETTSASVCVSVSNEEGAKPEFTWVER
ncbi:MAG: NAD(P)H-dependent oxidoreductase [Bacteroidaceae bacterium]|nr:NAD(P)H-dependent oxidoreductase [Bacteroidaceae bacterium]